MGTDNDEWVIVLHVAIVSGQQGERVDVIWSNDREVSTVQPTTLTWSLTCEPSQERYVEFTTHFGPLDSTKTDLAQRGTAHRYRRETALFDVLAPDNVGDRAQLQLGAGRTIEAPGTTQALRRSEVVQVDLGERSGLVRRPSLVGALLGKAAAVTKIASQTAADRSKHLRDFDSLSMMLGPSDRQGADLTKSERRVLQGLADEPGLSKLAVASLNLLIH